MNLSTIAQMFFNLTKRPRIWLALNFCCRLIPFLTFFRKKLEPQSHFPTFSPLFGGFQPVKNFFSPYIYIYICLNLFFIPLLLSLRAQNLFKGVQKGTNRTGSMRSVQIRGRLPPVPNIVFAKAQNDHKMTTK